MSGEFLPVTMEECRERGIEQPDFVYVCGDAYVDHSSFGAAIICRLLESRGYSVGMIAQPDWKDPERCQFSRWRDGTSTGPGGDRLWKSDSKNV